MRGINQAFTLGPKTWVWLIKIKKSIISNLFTQNVERNQTNNGLKRNEHSKWYPDDFKLDFESIQT